MDERATPWSEVVIGITFGMGFLVLLTIVVVVVIRAVTRTKVANAALTRDDAYRKLAENYDAHLSRTAAAERDIRDELASIRARIEAIESLLRSVD